MDKSSRISIARKSKVSFSTKSISANGGSVEIVLHPKTISSKEGIIQHFFEQLVEFIIEDFVYVDVENVAKQEAEEKILVKDFKNLTLEDIMNNDFASIEGSRVAFKVSDRMSTSSIERRFRSGSKALKDTLTKRLSASSRKSKSSSPRQNSKRSLVRSPKKSITKSSVSVLSCIQEMNEKEKELDARIVFLNGNVYEGTVKRKLMHGKGKFIWTDGTVYEGEFKDGYPTGKGEMILPDLSYYSGYLDHGFFHGRGYLNVVSTPMFYNGDWKYGKKHGSGWILYEPYNWYEGEWFEDQRHGFGTRIYKNGAKYRGNWCKGLQYGYGLLMWENNDFYKGQWIDGLFHGYGEYIWKAFFNKSFAFPLRNIYKGSWWLGKRHGKGFMQFGSNSGSKMTGYWQNNFKHGPAQVICGNGKIVSQEPLFDTDKPIFYMASGGSFYKMIPELPIFTVAEDVDVGFYIDKILQRITISDEDKLLALKAFEEKCVRNTIIIYLPKLSALYNKYSRLGAEKELNFMPVMVRMFLWQFYQDIDVSQFGLSLVDVDKILGDNPSSSLDTAHYPFEMIYFWQFLMLIVGLALTTSSLENIYDNSVLGGVSSFVLKKFLEEKIFKKLENHDGQNMFSFLNMIPINGVYSLYKDLGEPHAARTFLRHTCLKKHESSDCFLDLNSENNKSEYKIGSNYILLTEKITFSAARSLEISENRRSWKNLYDFRRLGARNIVRCLSEVCPLIKSEGIIVNMEYPLTFLEFYQTLLKCSFLVIELELQKEKKPLVQELEALSPKIKHHPIKSRQSSGRVDVEKKVSKTGKKKKKSKTKVT